MRRFSEISWSANIGGEARQYVWPMAIKGFEEKPLLGWGQDGFNYVFNKYYDPRMYKQEQWFDRVHDTPLDVLIAGGALGLIAYLAIFGAAVYLLWKRRSSIGVVDAALLLGLLAGYFAQNISVFDNLVSYIYFYIVLSYIHAKDTEEANVSAQKPIAKKSINPEAAHYIVAPILIVLCAGVVYFANIKPISANTSLINALQNYNEGPGKNLEYFKSALGYDTFGSPEIREQLLNIAPKVASLNIDTTVRQEFADLAFTEIQKQLIATPLDARYQFFAGIFLDNMNQFALATPYLEKAVMLSPKKQAMLFELTKNYAYLGQTAKALALAKSTYDLEPDFSDAKDNYIAMLFLNGNDALARNLMGAPTTTSDIIVRAFLIRAESFLQKGNTIAAIAEINRAIQIAPDFKEQGNTIISAVLKGKVK